MSRIACFGWNGWSSFEMWGSDCVRVMSWQFTMWFRDAVISLTGPSTFAIPSVLVPVSAPHP